MAHSSPARWLAPLALVAAALALGVVLSSGLSSSPSETSTPEPVTRTAHSGPKKTTKTTRTQSQPGASKTYTVQPGDFLSDVADKTGVPVERLRELNPGLDANSMHVGQRIRTAP